MAMRLSVTYTPYATSSKKQTGDVITFSQFEEGNILTETCNNAESGDESDNESIMMSKQHMENLDSNEDSDHDIISAEILEDIRDCRGESCNRGEAHARSNKMRAREKKGIENRRSYK